MNSARERAIAAGLNLVERYRAEKSHSMAARDATQLQAECLHRENSETPESGSLQIPDMHQDHNNAVISLFSGAGGLSLGFSAAGYAPSVAADVDADACATYAANLGDHIRNVDLSRPPQHFLRELDQYRNAFALIGGPPCQGFSSAGVKNGTDFRNRLIFSYLELVNRVRPRWFLFENVEGLLTSNEGRSVVELIKQFVSIGYNVRLEKVNLAAYGLPQARKRVLLIGNSKGIDFELPSPTHSFDAGKHRSLGSLPAAPCFDDAIAGLGQPTKSEQQLSKYSSEFPASDYDALMRDGNGSGGTTCHASGRITEYFREVLAQLGQGQTMKDVPERLWHDSFRKRAFRRVMDGTPSERRGGAPSGVKRLVGSLNSLTITSATTREFIHPHYDRPLTLREAARLQSFPDRFHFTGAANSIARQIGNAFPPLVAQILASHLGAIDRAKQKKAVVSRPTLVGFHLTDAEGMSPALNRTRQMLEALCANQATFEFYPALFTNRA